MIRFLAALYDAGFHGIRPHLNVMPFTSIRPSDVCELRQTPCSGPRLTRLSRHPLRHQVPQAGLANCLGKTGAGEYNPISDWDA